MPIGADPLVRQKQMLIIEVSRRLDYDVALPPYGEEYSNFSLAKLIEQMERADVVLADLSLERPSCYYELGIAECLGLRVKVLAEAATPIHQCNTDKDRVLFYTGLQGYEAVITRALVDDQ